MLTELRKKYPGTQRPKEMVCTHGDYSEQCSVVNFSV